MSQIELDILIVQDAVSKKYSAGIVDIPCITVHIDNSNDASSELKKALIHYVEMTFNKKLFNLIKNAKNESF